jgi:hypothetical protein
MKPAHFELSADARFLRQRLHELKPGDSVTYADLSKIIGKPVTGATPALQSAKRGLLKEGYVFSPVRGEAVRRLTDADVVAGDDLSPLRRHARRVAKKLSTVSYEQLNPAQQLQHTAKTSIVGMVATVTTDKAVAKIEKAAGGRSGELPIGETLKALGYNTD